MKLGSKFLKGKISALSKKVSEEEVDEFQQDQNGYSDDYDEEYNEYDDDYDDDYDDEYYDDQDELENDEDDVEQDLPVNRFRKVENQPKQMQDISSSSERANADYKYDFNSASNFSQRTTDDANFMHESKPLEIVRNNKTDYYESSIGKSSRETTAQVFSLVLASAEDVRTVVDCMKEKRVVAIYADMSQLSNLEERRSLDFIDGARYILKSKVKCLAPKKYMITQDYVSLSGNFQDIDV